ncbi:MAG: M13 family metallopeptidase [Bdellovibrionales bacterium]|nr:M13 family metallopeptidase [Bdellovibrionales bacterium]
MHKSQKCLIIGLMFAFTMIGCSKFDSSNAALPATPEKEVVTVEEIDPGKTTSETDIPVERDFPLNTKVGPCEDFYEYVCRPALDNFELPSDRSRWTFAFSDSAERLMRVKKEHLANSNMSTATKRAKQYLNFYQSCMNVDARAKEELRTVSTTIRSFDTLKAANKPKEALLNLLGRNSLTANASLVSIGAENNQKNSNVMDLIFDVDVRSLPDRSYYAMAEVMKDYEAMVALFFTSLGISDAEVRAHKLVEFEKAFAQVYPTRAEMREVWTKEDAGITRSEIKTLYPNLKMDAILAQVPNSTFIRHLFPEVYAFMNENLENMSFEEIRDLVLFVNLKGDLNKAYPQFYNAYRAFQVRHLGVPPVEAALDEQCTETTMGAFAKEMDEALYEQVFPNFPEDKFRSLVEKIRQTMDSKLQSNSWLKPETKTLALEKLRSIRMQVVKPQVEKDWDFLPLAKYKSTKYLKNIQTLSLANQEITLQKLKAAADKDKWSMNPLMVNAYYNPSESKFVMPVGILQYPFFDTTASDFVNLGAVGMVVGHEVGHSFDDEGSKFDKDGNINPWMSEEDLENLNTLAKRLDVQMVAACKAAIDDLENLTVEDGSPMPSKEELYKNCENPGETDKNYADLTRGENMGDLSGMHFAYETAFPGGAGSAQDKQKFFIQYGKVWCTKMRRGEYLKRMKTDPHAQVPMRTNEPIKHLNGFYEAFQCQPGDKMYIPENERLNIW